MRAKKGVVFEGVIFIVILVVLVTAFTTLYKKHNQFPVGYRIGDRQFSLIDSIQEAEEGLFYVDQAAQHSAGESIYEFADEGGISGEYKCGRFDGTNVWYEFKRTDKGHEYMDCFDETKIDENFIIIFDENLNNNLINNPYSIPLSNYEYHIDDNGITGLAKTPLKMNINVK